MKKKYTTPGMEIKNIVTESLLTASIEVINDRANPDESLGKWRSFNNDWEILGE